MRYVMTDSCTVEPPITKDSLVTCTDKFRADYFVQTYVSYKPAALTLEDCPLGTGVELFHGHLPEMRGLYTSAPTSGAPPGGGTYFHTDGCTEMDGCAATHQV